MSEQIPTWLKEIVGKSKAAFYTCGAQGTRAAVSALHTVCQEARCPNRGECFKRGEATIMILGARCTRFCGFCAVTKSCAPLPPDVNEPADVARAAAALGVKYLVLTMPTRDDLFDGGAAHIAAVVGAVKNQIPGVAVEPLISDLGGKFEFLPVIIESGCEVLAHNIETVPALYSSVRAGADYQRSLDLLKKAKQIKSSLITKSGLMLGLGESEAQLKAVIADLAAVGCDLLTLGQYLAPTAAHCAVKDYPKQEFYDYLKDFALKSGLKAVMAGPLVRSSYKASELYGQVK